MADGLSVSDFVRVDVTLEPAAAQTRNFGAGVIVTDTSLVDVTQRLVPYSNLTAVAQAAGTSAAVTKAATLFFSQEPQPSQIYVARWARTATNGLLHGASLSATQQLITNFSGISNGSLVVSVDGTARTLTGINLTGVLNLNGVAAAVQTALQALVPNARVIWGSVNRRFDIISGTTGPTSSVNYASAAGSGTDLSSLMHLTSFDASPPVPGVAPESLSACIANLADLSNDWYSLQVACDTPPSDGEAIAAAAIVEALSPSRIFGVTITNANVLDITVTTDLASQLQALNLSRSYSQFSSTNPYAAESLFGRAATVDFQGSNTTITLAYKQEPGVIAEPLRESQFRALLAKNCNVFTKVQNGTAIVFPGKMANGDYFDERQGCDWFQNELQTALYNLLYTTPTKVPQTDAGMNLIAAVIKSVCLKAVNNGFVAPGLWTGPSFGAIKTGDTLSSGFYIYTPPVALQSEADRAARKSVSFQVALKLAGAVHFIISAVLVDR
ncbi:DUF3383 domain-containing protein [Methylobacterium komagatae]